MKRTFTLALFVCALGSLRAQPPKEKAYHLLVGTYTNAEKTNGILVYSFNPETAETKLRSKVTDIANPSFLTVSRDNKNVYAISEVADGKVNAFSFDTKSGQLHLLNSMTAGGNGPCYVSVDDKKQVVFTANYGGGSLSATKLNKDGSLSDKNQAIQHAGSSVNKARQSKPHVHSVVLSPDNRFVLASDLGTDKINSYKITPEGNSLLLPAASPFTPVKPGGGPRHLTFHPDGKQAYLVLEMEAAVVAFDYKNGKLIEKQLVSLVDSGFTGKVGAADIHISADGKFLYATNRGEANDIAVFSIGKKGTLKFVGREKTGIDNPRNFAIDPTGNFVLVANQNSNNILIFKRNQKTGLLTPTNQQIHVDKPVCLKFAALE